MFCSKPSENTLLSDFPPCGDGLVTPWGKYQVITGKENDPPESSEVLLTFFKAQIENIEKSTVRALTFSQSEWWFAEPLGSQNTSP